MTSARAIYLCSALIAGSSSPAISASSEWHRVEGAGIRIITAGPADEDGTLRGALEIQLEPGWKTYWRDPGDSGVPPALQATADVPLEGIDIGFPAPRRFDDGYSIWTGYDHSVSLPLTFNFAGGIPQEIEIEAFLGVCATICIPVQAVLTVEPDSGVTNPGHATQVAAAFAALPEDARTDFRASVVEATPDALIVEAIVPPDAEPVDLFLASTESLSFGAPERVEGSTARFKAPILDRSEAETGPIHYTLATTTGAVSGTLALE